MTAAAQTLPAPSPSPGETAWQELRAAGDLQFAPVEIPEITPPEPNWFEQLLTRLFDFIGELLGPVGRALGGAWWWLQWVLLAAVAAFVAVLLFRMLKESGAMRRPAGTSLAPDWQPERGAALALLEDADRLAAAGRFDEATRLLLQRSVGHIAAARPDLVEPSSTARELAALGALPEAARTAFAAIAERVERSLFALKALERADWEAARAAYAEFALARLVAAEGGA